MKNFKVNYDSNSPYVAIGDNTAERIRISASGLHIGGTATANALDDYEEGDWTPTVTTSSSPTVYSGKYTKIGRLVNYSFYVSWGNTQNNDSNQFRIGGLPFTCISGNHYSAASMGYVGGANMNDALPIVQTGDTYIYFHQNDGTSSTHVNSEIHSRSLTSMIITGQYITA